VKEIKLTAEQKGLKPGDLVTAYAKGIHRIESISTESGRCSSGYLVFYRPVLDSRLNPVRLRPLKSCDIYYCRKVDWGYLENTLSSHKSQIDSLTAAIVAAYGEKK
jgi:hypothetical protein